MTRILIDPFSNPILDFFTTSYDQIFYTINIKKFVCLAISY